MEWITDLRKAIEFMEKHLLENISAQDVSAHVYMSDMYFQMGFRIITGCTISEYIRSRRLYLAAEEIVATDEKIIDMALKYCYDTPESFTKAFSRFHGVSPMQMRKNSYPIKAFLPLKINITVTGGSKMDYTVKKMEKFKVIGIAREFSFDNSYEKIPEFWDEICRKFLFSLRSGNQPKNDFEKAIVDNSIGEFGICSDCEDDKKVFKYMIAGKYKGGEIPEGMQLYQLPETEWAIFDCVGAMPDALQKVNTRIFKEWLPGNPEFEISYNMNVEWYSNSGKITDDDYKSSIWIPVKRK